MTLKLNGRSDEGKALGANMARFADVAEKEWREKMSFVPVRCASCAFTKGTYPNESLGTQANATKCVMEREPFYCHHDMNGDKPQRVCAGWMLLHSAEPPVKAPWDWLK